MRVFKNTKFNHGPLSNNAPHKFALTQTMRIFRSNTTFTWIPKNACSTMRFSIAKSNGCIEDLTDVNWIHANNLSFPATTETAAQSAYTFVILRCPYARLYSAFMDKMVNFDTQAWLFRNSCGRSFHVHDLTFKRFISELGNRPLPNLDIHWRRQTDFLLFEKYDDYFCLEDFSGASKIIEQKSQISIVDTRKALGHNTAPDATFTSDDKPYNIAAIDLLVQKRSGVVPDPKAMFDPEMVAIVKKIYAPDFALYGQKFGPSQLMDSFV